MISERELTNNQVVAAAVDVTPSARHAGTRGGKIVDMQARNRRMSLIIKGTARSNCLSIA